MRRAPERGTASRDVVHAILDAGLACHLGYLHGERPVVVPTLYGRDEDTLILHGSAASRAMRAGASGLPVCVTVTLLDGLVLARSAFHHSVNYRSVVIHGDAADLDLPVWAGVVPMGTVYGDPVAAPDVTEGLEAPASVQRAAAAPVTADTGVPAGLTGRFAGGSA